MIKIYSRNTKLIVDLNDEQEDVEEELKDEIRDILSVYPYVKGDGFEDEETYTIDFMNNEREQHALMDKLIELTTERNIETEEEKYWRYI